MSEITLGIIGGGQLGSMLAIAAKKLNVKTVVFCDDIDAPAQNFCNQFVTGSYDNKEKISEFINQVNLVTYEFENIPFETLNEINKFKPVLPKPSVNRLIQHRLAEKDFVNKLNIRTTRYVSIEKKSDIDALEDFFISFDKATKKCAPMATAATKEILSYSRDSSLEELSEFASGKFAECMLGEEAKEGLAAFAEKRKPYWYGA